MNLKKQCSLISNMAKSPNIVTEQPIGPTPIAHVITKPKSQALDFLVMSMQIRYY